MTNRLNPVEVVNMPRTRHMTIRARAAAVLAATIMVGTCFLYFSGTTSATAPTDNCSNFTAGPQTVPPGPESTSRADCLGGAADSANNCTGAAAEPEIVAPGWNASFRAGCYDAAGNLMGGSELMHLVGHDGMLFAAVGYWEDTANINYGGTNSSEGWAQILRLDSPNGQWAVDLTMKGVLRPDILDSVAFTTNGAGEPLSHPVSLLITAACRGNAGADLYTRNDTTGQWATSTIVASPTGPGCDARADALYQDPITGVDRLFVSLGDLGVYSGVYDPTAPGDILWSSTSESGRVAVRPLAITEANGNLFCSSGALVYERVNGPSPSWRVVVNETRLPGGTAVNPAVGGIRGLTALPNPNGSGQSLLFLWVPGNQSKGLIVRLDPNGSGGYTSTNETSLSPLASQYLNTSAAVVLGAYNNILPVTDPATGDVDYIIGLQVWVRNTTGLPTLWGDASGGIYQGTLYAIRGSDGSYRMGEVNGKFPAGNPPLEAIRSYALSPFPSDHGNVIYFGGYDADGHLCNNTAWVFRTTTAHALGEATYPASFAETGLPEGTTWSVDVNGTIVSSSNSTIELNETNGTYQYSIGPVPGYIASPASGVLPVDGAAVLQQVSFSRSPPVEYSITFAETGLPSGFNWSVTEGGIIASSTTNTITFARSNGTDTYAITDISGWHQATLPYTGTLVVSGAAVIEPTLVFMQVTYDVTFTETGLPSGTSWGVTVNGVTPYESSTTTLTFPASNGSSSFSVGPVAGYTVNQSSGSVIVNGTAIQRSITFTPQPEVTVLGLPPTEGYALLSGIVAAVLLALVLVVVLTKKERRAKPPTSPPGKVP